ncbi:yersiniabactin transcriptional regulator YbtA [Microvirgula curvata]
MPSPQPPSTSISALLAGQPVGHATPDTGCRLLRIALQDGVDVLVWKGELRQPMTVNVHDDWDRIHFSCALQGSSSYSFHGGCGELEHALAEGGGCINYNPGCRGRASHAATFESVTVSVRPDLFASWAPELERSLKQELGSGRCYAPCGHNAEMRATAQGLSRALHVMELGADDGARRSPLWLMGQSLTLVDRQRLLRARDRLLGDLSQAPTIAALAREADLSVLKLKRGFRLLFNNSVYGLFQQERMHEARRRLSARDTPVMTVASDLGYTNASHFAAAFQKQFGVNPSTLKRR